jgi:pantoate--beta-alanine ligase
LIAARDALAAGEHDALQLQTVLRKVLQAEPLAAIDYAEIVDADTFEPVVRVARPCYAVLAVFLGKTRLIDNLYIEPAATGTDDLIFHI